VVRIKVRTNNQIQLANSVVFEEFVNLVKIHPPVDEETESVVFDEERVAE